MQEGSILLSKPQLIDIQFIGVILNGFLVICAVLCFMVTIWQGASMKESTQFFNTILL